MKPCRLQQSDISSQQLSEKKKTIDIFQGGKKNAEVKLSRTQKAVCKTGTRHCGITGMWTVAMVLILCPDDSQCVVCVCVFFVCCFGFICVQL